MRAPLTVSSPRLNMAFAERQGTSCRNGFQRCPSASADSTIDTVWNTVGVGDISGILLPPAALPRATANLWGAKRPHVGWAAAQFTWPFRSLTPAVLSAKAPRLLAAPPRRSYLLYLAAATHPRELTGHTRLLLVRGQQSRRRVRQVSRLCPV